MNTRFVTCEYCDGEGRKYFGHPNDPEPMSSTCPVCQGATVVEIETEPVEMEDQT